MESNFLLEMCERSFERIGRVGDVKMRKMLEREEPWKICFQTPVGASQTLVREMPTMRERINSFLSQEVFPPLVPLREPVSKACFVGLLQEEHQSLQFLACFELGIARDVAQDNLYLVELAHLNRNRGKGSGQPSAGITDNANNVPFPFLQHMHARDVFRDCFVRKKFPKKIFATMGTTKNHDAENFSEVRRVHHQNHIADLEKMRLDHREVHLRLHPPAAPSKCLPDLFVGLFSMGVLFENSLGIHTSLLTKFLSTITALPTLSQLVRSILLYQP